jgi:hypothetical protein
MITIKQQKRKKSPSQRKKIRRKGKIRKEKNQTPKARIKNKGTRYPKNLTANNNETDEFKVYPLFYK